MIIAGTSAQLSIWIAVIITSATAQRKAASKNPIDTNLFGAPIASETLMDTQCVPRQSHEPLRTSGKDRQFERNPYWGVIIRLLDDDQ
jgi:hypothetical protein